MLKVVGINKLLILVCSVAYIIGLSAEASAQSAASVFQVKLRGTSYTCGLVSGKLKSGRLIKASGLFVSYAADIKALKAKIKAAKPAKKPALKKKLAALVAKAAAGDRVCKSSAAGKSPTPTPTPGGTPGATPKPTATPVAAGYFDANGNVTAAGKVKFGIPSNLSANKNTGANVYNAARSSLLGLKSCGGCHTERQNRTFGYMQAILPSPIMKITISAGDLANLTAYINRNQVP